MSRRDDTTSLPGAYARELLHLCARSGLTAEELLAGLGVTAAELSEPTTRVPLGTVEELVRRAVRLTGEPGLAFMMGLHMRLSWHGFLGFAAMTASTVGEALALAERFIGTRTTALTLRVHADGDAASVALEDQVGLGELLEFVVVALFVGIGQIGNAVTGQRLRATVELTFTERPYFRRFAHLVQGEVRFSRPANRLVFPRRFLDLPLVTADEVATRLAREQCERELAALGEGTRLVVRVRAALRAARPEDRSITAAARALSVSTRTLKRRLAEQGTTFSALLDEQRRQEALLLLDDARLSIDEIAARVGYSDTANFTRAFRRWTGVTPAAHRAR
ncbi:MAG: AraC family transcriptional regulator [Polyangiaceae bacterium]|nr:AraC family transcriptional regulator [Polyangiaceae bacterium]